MRYLLPVLLFLITAISCGNKKQVNLPLPDDQLIPVLIDIHIAEVALQSLRGDTRDSIAELYYTQICSIHQVEKAAIDSTLEILRNEPQRLEKLYGAAMEEVDRMAAENQSVGTQRD